MKIRHWLVLGACAPLAAIAQQVPEQQRPHDAGAAVPALTYSSAFEGFASSAASGEQPTPDQAWRPANEQVAGSGADHAGHAPQESAPAETPPASNAPPKNQQQHEAHKHD